MQRRLVLGSRGSPLALTQARNAQTALCAAAGTPFADAEARFPIQIVQTTADLETDKPLADIGGKGLFTKELDVWLTGGGIDIAVHSLKDVPHQLPEGIVHGGVLVREDPRDALITKKARNLAGLPKGATVGTCSPRRKAQLLNLRPDLNIVPLRGNVHSRLRKVTTEEVDATVLAAAGLVRLGKQNVIAEIFEPDVMLPAACQGVVALQSLAESEDALSLCAKADDAPTALTTAAERGFLSGINGTCHSAVAALADYDDGALVFRAEAFASDGARKWTRSERVALGPDDLAGASALGRTLGVELRDEAGEALMLAD